MQRSLVEAPANRGRESHTVLPMNGESRADSISDQIRQLTPEQRALFILRRTRRGVSQPPDEKISPIRGTRQDLQLSFAQQRLWFLTQTEGGSEAYHIPAGARLKGDLDGAALRKALDRIVARHEILRTTFVVKDGAPVQRISCAGSNALPLIEDDLRGRPDAEAELRYLLKREAATTFDLETGPLIRGRLIRLRDAEYGLLLTVHHIVFDGWSMAVLVNELNALYSAFLRGEADPLPEPEIQYADYAAWQRQRFEGETLQRQTAYWKAALAGAPPLLEVPADHSRPARQDYSGAYAEFALDEEQTAGINAVSRRHGATPFMTLLAVWGILLSRLSGQRDVVVGTPAAGRGRAEIENLIGLFINTLALRLDLSGSPTVSELLRRVKRQALDAQQNQDIPFEQIVALLKPMRTPSHSPIFQVMFAWENDRRSAIQLPGLEAEPLQSPYAVAKFDLTLSLQEIGNRIAGALGYATALFEPATIERYAGYFRNLAAAMVSGEEQPVDSLSMLSDSERRRLLDEWNDTGVEFARETCVHELFEKQANQNADRVAVACGEQQLSYGELNRRANQLAHYLRALGVQPEMPVALCMERSPEMIVGLLAVQKAGGVYVPLDPAYPTERLRWMVEDSGVGALLTEPAIAGRFRGISAPVIDLGDRAEWRRWPAHNPEKPAGSVNSERLLYVIYTSGSTGKPKGVMVSHRAVVNFLGSMEAEIGCGPEDILLAITTWSFDIAGLEVYLPLTRGACVRLVAREDARDGARLREELQSGASMMQATPANWRLVEEAGWEGSRGLKALCGGEALDVALAKRLAAKSGAAWNLYGPTETTIWSLLHKLGDEKEQVAIGRPIGNTQAYVLDERGEPAPAGVAGEVYIGGAGLARGYWRRPDLTAERFVANPFGETGSRMYATGDRGRWRADGELEYLGRNDHQVKVRGFRIELGEIEAVLAAQQAVAQAAVVAREDASGQKQLIGYVVAAGGQPIDGAGLRRSAADHLPDYMVPAAIVVLEALPLTANGKVDRKALPAAEFVSSQDSDQAPRTPEEETLAGLFAEVLQLERVGIGDNFFDLGGHSLLATRLISRIGAIWDIDVPVRAVFEAPTVDSLARRLFPVEVRAER